MAIKKPTLKAGEYGPAHEVKYVDENDPELSGTHTVELGAEFKSKSSPGQTRRWVRVDGKRLDMYGMVYGSGRGRSGDDSVLSAMRTSYCNAPPNGMPTGSFGPY